MAPSRREFIKFVVAGSVAAGCPIDHSLIAAPDSPAAPHPASVHGDHFDICHALRDGKQFERPAATHHSDVVIIGAGSAGLSAAYFLRDLDFLLLEKEDHFGGNAYQEDFQGQPYATGSAYAYQGDSGDQLMRELGVKLLPVNNPDPTIVNRTWVPDTWRSGIDQLPYPKNIRDSFRKFGEEMNKIDLRTRYMELDAEPFSKYTEPYPKEIGQWLDCAGFSNWGAGNEDTSAMLGIGSVQASVSDEPDGRVILPGGLGCLTHKLVEVLAPKHNDRMHDNATVVAVVQDKDSVRVTYVHEGKFTTVSAKAVLMCAPKLIASRVVFNLPSEQKQAMRNTRYAPYLLVNLIFDKPVYNRGYDTWCPGASFTDFIVADWTVRNTPGYKQKHNILTCYTPLRPEQRSTLLTEGDCRTLAARVLADFQALLREFNVDPIEVRLYRRGHPMFMPTPGRFTKTRVAAAQPMERIFFGHSDSGGPESLTSEAIRISKAGAEWAGLVLAGDSRAKEVAQKAIAASRFD